MTKPLLLDFPDSFSTERLVIRCPQAGDGALLNAAVVESLDDLRPWMPWAQSAPTLEESEEVCRRARSKWLAREDLMLFMFLKDGTFVGGTGLHRIEWSVPRFEIGYWLRVSQQGQGLMTEAVRGITRFAFEELNAERVEIRCDERNERSRSVIERASFVREACLRHDARDHLGLLRSTLVYSLLSSEWQSPPTE
jgi:RimJ/RimL family protein N-acetyltransferase